MSFNSNMTLCEAIQLVKYKDQQVKHCAGLYDEMQFMHEAKCKLLAIEQQRACDQSIQIRDLHDKLQSAEQQNQELHHRINVQENFCNVKDAYGAQILSKLKLIEHKNQTLLVEISNLEDRRFLNVEEARQTASVFKKELNSKCDLEAKLHRAAAESNYYKEKVELLNKTIHEHGLLKDTYICENSQLKKKVAYLDGERESLAWQVDQLTEIVHKCNTELNWTRSVLYDLSKKHCEQFAEQRDIISRLDEKVLSIKWNLLKEDQDKLLERTSHLITTNFAHIPELVALLNTTDQANITDKAKNVAQAPSPDCQSVLPSERRDNSYLSFTPLRAD